MLWRPTPPQSAIGDPCPRAVRREDLEDRARPRFARRRSGRPQCGRQPHAGLQRVTRQPERRRRVKPQRGGQQPAKRQRHAGLSPARPQCAKRPHAGQQRVRPQQQRTGQRCTKRPRAVRQLAGQQRVRPQPVTQPRAGPRHAKWPRASLQAARQLSARLPSRVAVGCRKWRRC